MLEKGLVYKSAGVAIPVWRETGGGGESLGFSQEGEGPRGWLATCVAKPMVGSSDSGLTRHGGNPAVSKFSEG